MYLYTQLTHVSCLLPTLFLVISIKWTSKMYYHIILTVLCCEVSIFFFGFVHLFSSFVFIHLFWFVFVFKWRQCFFPFRLASSLKQFFNRHFNIVSYFNAISNIISVKYYIFNGASRQFPSQNNLCNNWLP